MTLIYQAKTIMKDADAAAVAALDANRRYKMGKKYIQVSISGTLGKDTLKVLVKEGETNVSALVRSLERRTKLSILSPVFDRYSNGKAIYEIVLGKWVDSINAYSIMGKIWAVVPLE